MILTIRPTKKEEKLLIDLKDELKSQYISQALLKSASKVMNEIPELKKTITRLEKENNMLIEKYYVLAKILEQRKKAKELFKMYSNDIDKFMNDVLAEFDTAAAGSGDSG